MTKPLTHALPYIVGMLLGKWFTRDSNNYGSQQNSKDKLAKMNPTFLDPIQAGSFASNTRIGRSSLTTLIGCLAVLVALAEVFLPYRWNNSHLPSRFLAALYASLFRLAWSLVLAYLVLSCRHKRTRKCKKLDQSRSPSMVDSCQGCDQILSKSDPLEKDPEPIMCMCASGGSLLNRFLGLKVFAHLSRLSFVAYLIHLPLMSVFVAQTRGLFAFSHLLVIHLALSYILMTFSLSFILVHVIEFPFITLERYLFFRAFTSKREESSREREGSKDKDTRMSEMGNLGRTTFTSNQDSSLSVSVRL